MQVARPSTTQPATPTVQIPPFVAPEREGELAARVIGEVVRQQYAPALRVSMYLCFMAAGRVAAWQEWRSTLQGFGGSMFQHPFMALAEQIGLDEANERIGAFGKAFAENFEQGLDAVQAGRLPGSGFSARDQARMQDWLALLEKVDDSLTGLLDQMYGPRKKPGWFHSPRWVAPGAALDS